MHRRTMVIACAALLLGGCAPAGSTSAGPSGHGAPPVDGSRYTAQQPPRTTSDDHPPYVRQLPNGIAAVHSEPAIPVLSREQEAALLAALQAIPQFSPYIYSGCHDRAHALWMLLPEALRAYTAKVWLLAPAAMTLALTDVLTIPELGASSPRWGYHVALVYRSESGVRVLDPTTENWSTEPLSQAAWLDRIQTPYGTVMTTLDPKLYLFYAVKGQDTQPTNNLLSTVVNNGQFFECVENCRTDANIETALARDDVGAILAARGGCSYLLSEVRKPGTLLTKLKGNAAPPECAPLMTEFVQRRQYWHDLLWNPRT
jgi:hypothetical protein